MKKILSACLLLLALHFNAFAQEAVRGTELQPVYQNGRGGYADPKGKVIINTQFDAARPFVDGLAQVGVLDEELPELDARPNIKWGYIDRTGAFVIAPQFKDTRDRKSTRLNSSHEWISR